jgi:hypothetical protein
MNRLQVEWHRLYASQATASPGADVGDAGLIDATGHVRAMVLELARPADWAAVSRVWNGVQADLELPAPAIAVSGADGYQLWFSLLEPLPAPQAMAFLESLRGRYLGDIRSDRVSLMPAHAASPTSSLLPPFRHARQVPAPQDISGRWSAFVAPDLAPMFADEPWLDTSPNDDGQSRLLSRLKSISPADLQRALALLSPVSMPPLPQPAQAAIPAATPATTPAATPAPGQNPLHHHPAQPAAAVDPKAFLLGVMNDVTVALGLRIEAAKALLHDARESARR